MENVWRNFDLLTEWITGNISELIDGRVFWKISCEVFFDKFLEDPLKEILEGFPFHPMKCVIKELSQVVEFPNKIPGGFSKAILGAISRQLLG